eukprot:1157261-Pelagomonas_calceolata.AAC.2
MALGIHLFRVLLLLVMCILCIMYKSAASFSMYQAILKAVYFYYAPTLSLGSTGGVAILLSCKYMVWKVNDPETSPEVYYTLQAMAAEGVDFMLDVHGDEELPVRDYFAVAIGFMLVDLLMWCRLCRHATASTCDRLHAGCA